MLNASWAELHDRYSRRELYTVCIKTCVGGRCNILVGNDGLAHQRYILNKTVVHLQEMN